MRHLKTTLAVLGAATILVLAGNTIAMAATGKAFILGKTNYANKATTVKRTTNGQALKVLTKRSVDAPLVVNGRGKVGNLNADMVDGIDSTALKNNVRVFQGVIPGAAPVTNYTKNLPLPAGTYTVSWSAFLSGAANGFVNCYVRTKNAVNSTLNYTADNGFNAGAGSPSLSATGLVTVGTGRSVEFHCASTNPVSTIALEPIQIIVTKVDSVISTTNLRTVPNGSRVGR